MSKQGSLQVVQFTTALFWWLKIKDLFRGCSERLWCDIVCQEALDIKLNVQGSSSSGRGVPENIWLP